MYAAPTTLRIVKATTDASMTAPSPNAIATVTTKAPAELPTTVSSPPTLPSESDRPMVNSTLGPGMTMSGTEASAKAMRLAVGIT